MHLIPFRARCRKLAVAGGAGLFLLVLSGCNSDQEPITAKTSKYEVAGEDSNAASSTDSSGTAGVEPADSGDAPPARVNPIRPVEPSGTGKTNPSAGDATDAGQAIPKKPSSIPPTDLGSKSRGKDPEAVLTRIGELQASLNPAQICGASQEERLTNVVNIVREIDRLAETVLTSKAAGNLQAAAAQAKFQSLMMLDELRQPEAAEDLKMFIAAMANSDVPELKRFGRNITFAMAMDDFTTNPKADSAKLLKDFKSLFADENKDEALMLLGRQVAITFIRLNKKDEARAVMTTIQEGFQNSTDPKLVAQANALGVEIKLLDLDINSKFEAFMKGEPNSEKPLMDVLQQILTDKEMAKQSIPIAFQIVQNIEATQFDVAGEVYAKLKTAVEANGDAELSKEVVTAVEDYEKRKALIGQPIEVVGATLKGEPFDWSQYKGKVVLIDMWATWCEPCLREIPNLKESYDRYHDQGFEIVGLNLDDDRRNVEAFFSLQKLPWTTIVSSDPNKMGFDHPLAVKFNVKAIPFLLLVGRDGNVITLNTRGPLLGKKLAELFPEKTKSEK